MATKRARKRPAPKRRAGIAMPREVRAAYREVQKGVEHLDTSIADLTAGLRRAEQKIESDARRRIRELRKDARAKLKALQARQRDAARTLDRLSLAAGESWREIKRSADSIFADARATANAVGKQFRRALRA